MNQPSHDSLLLMGIGGGASHLVSRVAAAYGEGIRVLRVDTDSSTGTQDADTPFLLFGGTRLSGRGAGGDPTAARLAVLDNSKEIIAAAENAHTVMLVTCLGGGTGTGATPEIARALHEKGFTVITVATTPFGFEGETRVQAAASVLPALEEASGTLVKMPLDDLFAVDDTTTLAEAAEAATVRIADNLLLLWRLIFKPGFINSDVERLHALADNGGIARMGSVRATGNNRAAAALDALLNQTQLKENGGVASAHALLVGIVAGEDLRLAEIGEIMRGLNARCKPNCRVEMGTALSSDFNGTLALTVLAFDGWDVLSSPAVTGETPPAPPVATDVLKPEAPKKQPRRGHLARKKAQTTRVASDFFKRVPSTVINGVDFDTPTYLRRGIPLER